MRYYKRIDKNGETTTVESYSHNAPVEGAIEIDKEVFDAYGASLPKREPELIIEYATKKELDDLKLELKGKRVID